jgi:hypothetical protein
MKKTIFTVFISVIYFNLSFSQSLIVDAGSNKYICVNNGITNGVLGGNPTITGTFPPFEVAWKTNHIIGASIFRASYFLDDTTKQNPSMINYSPLPITFYLIVKDNTNQIVMDTVIIQSSAFFSLPEPNTQIINEGDTTIISLSVFGGVPPYNYNWSPNSNISDTTNSSPSVWPIQTTVYNCTVTDAAGCSLTTGGNYVTVNVWPVSTKQALIKDLKIYPNPTQDYLIIELDKGRIQYLKITDMSGRVVLQQSKVINNQIDISHLALGTYILTLEDEKENVGSFQILKR